MRTLFAAGAVVTLALAACNSSDGPQAPTGPAAATPSVATTTTTSAPAERIVREARLEDANGYQTMGTARIVETGGEFSLELLDDFRTSQSPALDVRLCTEPNCRSGPELDLGDLLAFSGAQSYPLPDDGARYSHAVIYCRAVELAFGFGVLR